MEDEKKQCKFKLGIYIDGKMGIICETHGFKFSKLRPECRKEFDKTREQIAKKLELEIFHGQS